MKQSKISHELQFENEHVCVWKMVILPGEQFGWDEYQSKKIIIGLKEGKLKGKGKNKEEMILETHKAYWLESGGKEELQGNFNYGEEPIEIMVIEMKQVKNRPLPSIPID